MSPATKENTGKAVASEFALSRWSVVSMEECAASNLSYEEAASLVRKMSDSVTGLCIVTDEAARRLYNKQKTVDSGKLSFVVAPNTFSETL